MAKIVNKSEKPTSIGGIFSIMSGHEFAIASSLPNVTISAVAESFTADWIIEFNVYKP